MILDRHIPQGADSEPAQEADHAADQLTEAYGPRGSSSPRSPVSFPTATPGNVHTENGPTLYCLTAKRRKKRQKAE